MLHLHIRGNFTTFFNWRRNTCSYLSLCIPKQGKLHMLSSVWDGIIVCSLVISERAKYPEGSWLNVTDLENLRRLNIISKLSQD